MDGVMHMRMARWACRKVEDKYPVWGAHIEDAAISSTYPDAYIFGEDAKDKSGWDPLWRELDQIPTEQGPRPAQTIFDTLRLRETYPIVFRYLIHLSVESLRASRDELGVKAAGTLSHLIGDTVQAAHTTDNRMVTAMYPMGSWRYMTHAFMEAVFAELPDSVPYAPRLLADSEEMLCWRLCEELEKDKRLSIGEIPNLMGALRRGDQRAAEESAYRSAMTGAQLLADVTAALSLPAGEREKLGQYGRSVVQQHYSVHRMTDDCLSVYDQVRRRRHRVVMSGYYGFSNAGDDAILEAIKQAIHEASDDVAVTVLSNDPELTRKQYGMDAIPRFRVWKVFSALRRSDALLSGGGSLLQDTTSTRSLLYYLSVIRCAQWLGKPVMLYANGIGPVRRPANRRRVKKVVERATLVTLRDHSSARELADMGVSRRDLHVTADPVFHLSPAPVERGQELLQTAGLTPDSPFVAVSVRDWPNTGDFCRELARLCDHLRRAHGMEVLFLLMQPSRDRAAARQVQGLMKEPSFLLDEPCTPRELMSVLGQARLCLAMRLHTLIFAARMAVPSMGLVYDPKVDSYLQELELPAAGHVDSFDGDEAIRRADAMMADYDTVLARLRQKSAQLTQAARENERLLLEMLEQHEN